MPAPGSSSHGAAAAARSDPGTLAGQSASPGIAFGPAVFNLGGLEEVAARVLSDEEVEQELGRLDSVARAARVSLVRQRSALASHFTVEQRRVFDTHLQLLQDPVIEADVRERIRNQRMSLEGAVKDALGVYERLFEVVQSQSLRNKLSDMRDVALRLLRFAQRPAAPHQAPSVRSGVLLVRELSLSDLTESLEHGIAAIVAEGGSLGSHGAILTRAAGIPAVIGVKGLAAAAKPGDMLLVDGDAGQVTLNPPQELVTTALGRTTEGMVKALGPAALADGTPIRLRAAVASPSEARTAVALGAREIGLYRTDLPVLQRHGAPRESSLAALYKQVLAAADLVIFRLPDLDSTCGVRAIYPASEANPALGLRGARLLLQRPEMLATQLRAAMRAAEGRPLAFALPFVTDPGDLKPVRDAIEAAVAELRLHGVEQTRAVRLGCVIEVPSAALLAREIFARSDFVLIGLDNFGQHLLAADRQHPDAEVSGRLRGPHPVILRAVRKLLQIASALQKETSVYGESILEGAALPLLVGLGVDTLTVRPSQLAAVHARLRQFDLDECRLVAEAACHAATSAGVEAHVPAGWK
ncbi:MAG: phosphoenolpyruvate--protein phosphotransferase [Planctomycetota bacterium]|nr:MAG: phosphoenolpyruvate--protein phosphotransferase [Planctomycetota bacterium]